MRIASLIVLLFLTSCSTLESIDPLKAVGAKGVKPEKKFFSAQWTKNIDPRHETGNLPIALHSPFINEGVLFLGEDAGYMGAYDLDTGKPLWREYDGSGYHSQPIFFKDKVIYGTAEGRVYARHHQTGELLYNIDLGSTVESKASIYKGRIYLHLRNHKVFCLDANTGKILWAYKRSVPFLTTIQGVSKPVIYKNRVFVGFADGFVAAFSPDEGIIQWERKIVDGNKFIDVDTSPIIFNQQLIMGSISGPVTVINPRTGNILRKLSYYISRAPIVVNKKLVLGTIDGDLIVMDKNFKVLMSKKVSKSGLSSMKLWKNRLIVTSNGGEILSVKFSDLEVKEKFHLGHATSAVFGDLSIGGDLLAILSSRNRLYVFK